MFKMFRKKFLQLLLLDSLRRTVLVHTLLGTPAPCLQTGSASVMEKIHQEYRDFIGHIRDLRGYRISRAQLTQPTLPLFIALCH